MSSSILSTDKFLQQKQIQIQRSNFLYNHYANKQFALRKSYNPLDPFGSRLSIYWQPGDTKWSVIRKKIRRNIIAMLNPDTYSKYSLMLLAKNIIKYKLEIFGTIILIGTPSLIIYPILRPHFQRIKRQFLFQHYLQSQSLAKALKTKNKKLPVYQVQDIITKKQSKIRL